MPLKKTGGLTLEAIQDYFMHLNPIAQRIAMDIRDTKLAYGQLWYTLKPNEQNNIINETLIKPEIAIKYFDAMSTGSTPSTSSSFPGTNTASSDSLAAMVLKNLNSPKDEADVQSRKKHSEDKVMSRNIPAQEFHEFDGQNLKTFVIQKVALKIIQDEALGPYRDEHSRPFSYRTKSQIDLHLFEGNECMNDKAFANESHICLVNSNTVGSVYNKTKAVLPESKVTPPLNAQMHHETKRVPDVVAQEFVNKQVQESNILNNRNDNELPLTACALKKSAKKATDKYFTTNFYNSNNSTNNFSVKSAKVPSMSYVLYGDNYIESGENLNLVNCRREALNENLSSATASEDEDNDEETLCEEVNLLDTDISTRRGFDFLNNW